MSKSGGCNFEQLRNSQHQNYIEKFTALVEDNNGRNTIEESELTDSLSVPTQEKDGGEHDSGDGQDVKTDDDSDHQVSEARTHSVIYDIFIYSPTITDSVLNIINILSTQQHFLCCDPRSFIPGETKLDNFGNSLDCSRQLILFVTPDFLKCPLSMYYVQMALTHKFEYMESYRIVAITDGVQKCNLPKILRNIKRISTTHKEWTEMLLSYVRLEDFGDGQHSYNTCTDTTMSDPLPFRDIPEVVKNKNRVLLKKLNVSMEQRTALLKPVEYDKVDFDTNMAYFYKLKYHQKPVFEVNTTFRNQNGSADAGDIVVVVHSQRCKNKVLIQNALDQRMNIKTTLISPVLDFPSIMTNKFHAHISTTDNSKYQEELKSLGCRVFRAKDTIQCQCRGTSLAVNQGDILQLIGEQSENNGNILVRNCRGETGVVNKLTVEPVIL